MKKNYLPKLFKVAILSIFSLTFLAFLPSANAQEKPETGLRISPPVIELTLEKGEVYQEIIKIENLGSETQTYYPQVMSFTARGEEGAQEFLEAEGDDENGAELRNPGDGVPAQQGVQSNGGQGGDQWDGPPSLAWLGWLRVLACCGHGIEGNGD